MKKQTNFNTLSKVMICGLLISCNNGINGPLAMAHYETVFVLKKLNIEFNEVECLEGNGSSVYCTINKRNLFNSKNIIGISNCKYYDCIINLK